MPRWYHAQAHNKPRCCNDLTRQNASIARLARWLTYTLPLIVLPDPLLPSPGAWHLCRINTTATNAEISTGEKNERQTINSRRTETNKQQSKSLQHVTQAWLASSKNKHTRTHHGRCDQAQASSIPRSTSPRQLGRGAKKINNNNWREINKS